MEHTKGPWRVEEEPGCYEILGNTIDIEVPKEFQGISEGATRSTMVCKVYEQQEGEANARLIAAAPELLEACKSLLDAPHHEHFAARLNDAEMAAIDRMKAAVAKATGREQRDG